MAKIFNIEQAKADGCEWRKSEIGLWRQGEFILKGEGGYLVRDGIDGCLWGVDAGNIRNLIRCTSLCDFCKTIHSPDDYCPKLRAARPTATDEHAGIGISTAREVAARVWCDQEMGKVSMDTDVAEHIAQLIHDLPVNPSGPSLGKRGADEHVVVVWFNAKTGEIINAAPEHGRTVCKDDEIAVYIRFRSDKLTAVKYAGGEWVGLFSLDSQKGVASDEALGEFNAVCQTLIDERDTANKELKSLTTSHRVLTENHNRVLAKAHGNAKASDGWRNELERVKGYVKRYCVTARQHIADGNTTMAFGHLLGLEDFCQPAPISGPDSPGYRAGGQQLTLSEASELAINAGKAAEQARLDAIAPTPNDTCAAYDPCNKGERDDTEAGEVDFKRDGDKWCATIRGEFVNLQESPAGFGYTRKEARDKLQLEVSRRSRCS